jgi:hypothetical protein
MLSFQQQQQQYTFFADQHEIQWKTEEPYYMIQTNNPYTFYVPDKYDPNHFMSWVHPFTSVFVHEIVQNDQVFISGVEGVQVRQSLLKVHPIYGSV